MSSKTVTNTKTAFDADTNPDIPVSMEAGAIDTGTQRVCLADEQITTLTPPAAITGFSTEATLALIKAKTDNIPALGQALEAASVPVVLTAAQITTLTPPAAITGYATLAEQQTQTASLSVLDDWDETDRAKVNPIVGQAGLQGGAGAVSANTIRAVLATDQTTIPVTATQSGTWNINNVSGTVSLPTGASTSANQSTEIARLDTLILATDTLEASFTTLNAKDFATQTTLSALNTKVTACNTGAVVVSSSALPTGAATSALQTQPGVDIGDVTINNAAGASAVNIQDGGNSITVDGAVTTTAATLTAASPTASSVGVASAQILASATYKRVELVNTSSNTISIGIGAAAVLNSGMTMIGAGSSATIEGPFTAAVNAIASVAASNLAIQAWT